MNDDSNILHSAHYACLSSTTSLPVRVRRRVEFKLAILVYKALHSLALLYLSNDCMLVAEVGRRLSSDARRCVVPRTRTQFGDRSFAVVGQWVWDSLPAPLHDTNSIYSFRK